MPARLPDSSCAVVKPGTLWSLLSLALLLPAPASAQLEGLLSLAGRFLHHADPGPVLMTREAFLERRVALFLARDRDGDGALDRAEQQDLPTPAPDPEATGLLAEVQAAMRPGRMDADGDGLITRAEFDAASAALFALFAIFLAIKVTRFGATRLWPLISACLFMAYLCRPTLALLSPFLLLFVFSYHRMVAIQAGALLAVFLLALVGLSMHEWGQILPDYYLPQRLSGTQFGLALYGNLLSPARGLLVYSPFIALAWLCYRDAIPSLSLKKSWLLIGLAWPVLHWIAISRFPVWAAGWSYGPRFMTDVLPGLFLLTIRTWPVSVALSGRRVAVVVLALGCAFAVYVNAWQGLFNPYTARWNMQPGIGDHPEYLFDWRYPQFLHNQARHDARINGTTAKLGYLPLAFAPSWARKEDAGMSAPYAMMSFTKGARFTFTATGCFDIGMLKHGWSGIAQVSRDGQFLRDIDLYSQETDRTFKAFFEADAKPHSYTVEVTDKKNPASGGQEVWVDGVIPRKNCHS